MDYLTGGLSNGWIIYKPNEVKDAERYKSRAHKDVQYKNILKSAWNPNWSSKVCFCMNIKCPGWNRKQKKMSFFLHVFRTLLEFSIFYYHIFTAETNRTSYREKIKRVQQENQRAGIGESNLIVWRHFTFVVFVSAADSDRDPVGSGLFFSNF